MATVVGLFQDVEEARAAVEKLRAINIPAGDISVAARSQDDEEAEFATGAGAGAASGAVTGGVLGGLAGLLAGAGLLAVPGIGPIVAAGPLASTLLGVGIGATAGGLIGALVNAGVPEEEAALYEQGIARGGVLVTAQVPDGQESAAQALMDEAGARNIGADARNYTDPSFNYGRSGSERTPIRDDVRHDAAAGAAGSGAGGVLATGRGAAVAQPGGARSDDASGGVNRDLEIAAGAGAGIMGSGGLGGPTGATAQSAVAGYGQDVDDQMLADRAGRHTDENSGLPDAAAPYPESVMEGGSTVDENTDTMFGSTTSDLASSTTGGYPSVTQGGYTGTDVRGTDIGRVDIEDDKDR